MSNRYWNWNKILGKCQVCGKKIDLEDKKFMLAYDGPPEVYRNVWIHRRCKDDIYARRTENTKT